MDRVARIAQYTIAFKTSGVLLAIEAAPLSFAAGLQALFLTPADVRHRSTRFVSVKQAVHASRR